MSKLQGKGFALAEGDKLLYRFVQCNSLDREDQRSQMQIGCPTWI
jgi:hypothetical protein